MAVRKVDGIELALVDNSVIQIRSLEPDVDSRSASIKVAGESALLTAKAYKIRDRLADATPGRLSDKDAGDVIRLMRTSNVRVVSATFSDLLRNPDDRISRTAAIGLRSLKEQFGQVRSPGIQMAERALAGALPAETIRGLATAYVRELPDGDDSS
jgi:hypothetical protein